MNRDIPVLILTTIATIGSTIMNSKNLVRLFTGQGVGLFQLILCIMNVGLLVAGVVLWILFIRERNDPEKNAVEEAATSPEGTDTAEETDSAEETAPSKDEQKVE